MLVVVPEAEHVYIVSPFRHHDFQFVIDRVINLPDYAGTGSVKAIKDKVDGIDGGTTVRPGFK